MAETNYNSFFEEVSANSSSTSTTTTATTINLTSNDGTFDNGKCSCVELLKLLLRKTDAIEDHLIKIDVKINHLDSMPSNTRQVLKLGNVDMDQLKQFELPSESEAHLESLEKKLKNDFEFKTRLVS